jgi:hypothetical protein
MGPFAVYLTMCRFVLLDKVWLDVTVAEMKINWTDVALAFIGIGLVLATVGAIAIVAALINVGVGLVVVGVPMVFVDLVRLTRGSGQSRYF